MTYVKVEKIDSVSVISICFEPRMNALERPL
jgi:hypothetical protein